MNDERFKKIFTLLCILFPIIYTYITPVASVTLADIILIILMFLSILKIKNYKTNYKFSAFFLIILFVIITRQLLAIYTNTIANEDMFSFIRVIMYYAFITLFVPLFYDTNNAYKYYKNVALFASIFIILQYAVMLIFHKYIPGTLPFLKTSEDIAIFNLKMSSTLFDRPRSIFIEPAHFAMYVSTFLMLYLHTENKVNYKVLFILTLALFISGSTTGISICIIIYLAYFINNTNLNKNNISKNLLLAFIFAFSLIIFLNSKSFDLFIKRTFETNLAVSGRLGSYDLLFLNDFSNLKKILGIGMYKTITFYPSVIRIFLFYGYIGVITYLSCIIYTYLHSNKLGKKILMIFFAFSFISSIVFSRWIILFYPLIINNKKGDVK